MDSKKSGRIVVDESVLANLFGSGPVEVTPEPEVETDAEGPAGTSGKLVTPAPPSGDREVPESVGAAAAPVSEEVVETGGGESVYDRESLLSRALMLSPVANPAPEVTDRKPESDRVEPVQRAGSVTNPASLPVKASQPAIEVDEDDPEWLHQQGNQRFSNGDYALAEESYGKVLEIDPDSWSARFNLGLVLELLDRHEDALAEYGTARMLDGDRIEAVERSGFVQLRLAEYDKALADFRSVLAAEPQSSLALFGKGCAHQGLGMFKEANECYQTLMEDFSGNDEFLENLAATCLELKDYPNAKECVGQMAEGSEQTEECLRLRIDCSGANRDDEAVAQLSAQLVEMDKGSYEAWFNLGVACQHTGRLEVAVEAYKQALELDPDRPEAQVNLGALLHESENLVEARDFYEAALRSGLDNHPGVNWNLGLVAESLGAFEVAEKAYRETVQSQPEWKDAVGRLKRLGPS